MFQKVSAQQAHYYQQPSTQPYAYSSPNYEYSTPQTSSSSNSYASSYSPSSYHSSYAAQYANPQPYSTTVSSPLDASSISSCYYQSSQPVSSFSSSHITAPPPIDIPTYVQSVQTAAPSSISSSYYQYSPSSSYTSPSPQSYITTTPSPMDISSSGSISYLPSSQPSSYFTATSSPLAAPSINSVTYIQSDQPVSSYSSSYVTATSSPVEITYINPAVSSTAPSPYVTAASSHNDLSSMASVSYIQANPSVPSPVKSTYTNHPTYPPPNHTSQPKCTMISGGKLIEVPCYTLPKEPKKTLPTSVGNTSVLPVETPKPLKETSISYQHPPRPSQNSSPTTAEPIPPTNPPIDYPCPLCSALKNSGARNFESSIMPPPAPSPLIPGILNDIPSTFPPQKRIPMKKSSVKSNIRQKPKPKEGPLIYLPVSDEGKLLEKLLTGLGY